MVCIVFAFSPANMRRRFSESLASELHASSEIERALRGGWGIRFADAIIMAASRTNGESGEWHHREDTRKSGEKDRSGWTR